MKQKDERGAGELLGVLLVFAAIMVFGTFGAVMLQSANDGYKVDNTTELGQTAATNNHLMSLIIQNWPIVAILAFLLVIGVLAATTFRSGGSNGRV